MRLTRRKIVIWHRNIKELYLNVILYKIKEFGKVVYLLRINLFNKHMTIKLEIEKNISCSGMEFYEIQGMLFNIFRTENGKQLKNILFEDFILLGGL